MHNIPNAFQRKSLWTAITAVSIAVTGALVVGLVYLITRVIAFLQPLLIPFAVAGVLAYLLEPVVAWLGRKKVKRQHSVWMVFSAATLVFVGVLLIIIPAMVEQSAEFAGYVRTNAPGLRKSVMHWVVGINDRLRRDIGLDLLKPHDAPATPESKPESTAPPSPQATTPTPSTETPAPPLSPVTPPPAATTVTVADPSHSTATPAPTAPGAATTISPTTTTAAKTSPEYDLQSLLSGEWLGKELPSLTAKAWGFVRDGIGGFLGVFGFLLSMIIVPLYLYYFLTEGPKIAESWSHYVPLRASEFKTELVETLEEINRYLIAFFRGQLVVSLINGIVTAIGLTILGLKFGWLIGLFLCILGIIPYVGVIICWMPSVIIASVQHDNWFLSAQSPWWAFPLAVTAVFVVVQKIDSFFITPRVVGDSVGLHPMTVIVSLFAWGLVLGGLLGAILAVPMTAAVKVLFQRYIWRRTVEPHLPSPARHQVELAAKER